MSVWLSGMACALGPLYLLKQTDGAVSTNIPFCNGIPDSGPVLNQAAAARLASLEDFNF